jgi:hypothetical protein
LGSSERTRSGTTTRQNLNAASNRLGLSALFVEKAGHARRARRHVAPGYGEMQMIRNRTFPAKTIVIALGVLGSTPAFLSAAVVPLGNSGWEAIIDDQSFNQGLVAINHNSYDPSIPATFFQKTAEFTEPFVNGQGQSVPITFRQTRGDLPGLPVARWLVINDEVITNSTGSTWLDFHFELLDSGDAGFDVGRTSTSGGPPPIGFSISPFTGAAFSVPSPQGPTQLDIFGGPGIPHGGVWFPGDGPSDGQLWISVNPHQQAPFTVFTLKETPTIPEPGLCSLFVLGGLMLIRRRDNN